MSLGLPVYNGERQLRRALDCLLAQDYSRFELLISDNASTDGTGKICEEYAARDQRIRLNINETNIGIIGNFQLVLDLARGKYFMWAAHDDVWAKTFVSAMVGELENHPDTAVAMSAVERVHENGTPFDMVRHEGATDPNVMTPFKLALALAEGSPHHLFVYGLFRTEFLRQVFQNFPRVIAADRLMMIQAALSARFRYVDEVLHTRYINDQPIPVRYKDEDLGRLWQDRRAHLKKDLAIGPYLLQSQIIPWQRKFWIPIIVIWPPLRRLYYRTHFNRLLARLLGQGGRRKRIVSYLKRLGNVNSR